MVPAQDKPCFSYLPLAITPLPPNNRRFHRPRKQRRVICPWHTLLPIKGEELELPDQACHNAVHMTHADSTFRFRARSTSGILRMHLQILLRKHRHGPTGDVTLGWRPDMMRFLDIEQNREDY